MKKNFLKMSTLMVLLFFATGLNSFAQVNNSDAVLLTESFDGTTFPPTGWANTQLSGTGLWDRVTAGTYPTCTPHSGAGMARYASYNFSSGVSALLVTPVIAFPAGVAKTVNFWMYRDPGYSGNYDSVGVYCNTAANLTGARFLGNVRRYNAAAGWFQFNYTVPASVSGNYYVIFKGYSGYGNNMFIDDITVSSADPTCAYTATAFAPITAYPNLPAATYFSAAAWIDNVLYVQAPTSAGAGATTIYKYTMGAGWTTGTACLTAVAGASMTNCGGKLYLIGGSAGVTTGGTTVQCFDPVANTWSAKAPLPVALSAHNSVCWGDSVIFVVGGPYTGAATNLNVHYYRPASNTWGTITNSLPAGQGRRTFAMAINNGNKIVISCGYNTAYLRSTYVGTIGANAASITWAPGANAPQALSRPAGAGYDNTFFLVGGDTNGTAVKNDKIYRYNVTGNTWMTPILGNPNPVSNVCAGVTAKCYNDTVRIFQPGGYTTAASNLFAVTRGGSVGINNFVNNDNELLQNYPNPFNNTTIIAYNLKENTNVVLKVYDLMGKEVSTLVNKSQTAGKYEVSFDASNLPAGIYVYQLTTNSFSQSKRMMVGK